MLPALASLLLFAPPALAGLEKFSALVVADARPNEPAPLDTIRVTYLGVNGYCFELGEHRLLVDPYFSRVGLLAVLFNRPIAPRRQNVDLGFGHIPRPVDAILVTHGHFDHLLDVPNLMQRTGARLIAGSTAVKLAKAAGARRDQCDAAVAGSVRAIGPWRISVYRASHDRVIGSSPPFPGTVSSLPPAPTKPSDWRLGEPLAFVIEAAGRKIYLDSGGTPALPLDSRIGKVDLAILGVALPDSRARFAAAVRQLQPRYILPSHQDDFFAPLQGGFVFGKLTNFPAVQKTFAVERLPGRLILLDYFKPWTLR